jgi:hypothetical protein
VLTQRLNRLERELRWWKWGGLGALLLLVGLGAAPPRTASLEGKQLVIRDSAGRSPVVVGQSVPRVPSQPSAPAASASSQFGLFVYGEDGEELINLTAGGRLAGDADAGLDIRVCALTAWCLMVCC